MAAPATLITRDITGKYVLNAKLSDPNAVEDILKIQSVPWLLRKAITLATVTFSIKHYLDEFGVENMEVVNTLNGGLPGNTELIVLDWTNRSYEDYVFGKVLGKAKRVDLPRMIEDDYLKEGWDAHQSGEEDGVLLFYDESAVENRHWIAEQVWGFTELKGERRHVRRIRMTGKDGKVRCFQLAYDYHYFDDFAYGQLDVGMI